MVRQMGFALRPRRAPGLLGPEKEFSCAAGARSWAVEGRQRLHVASHT